MPVHPRCSLQKLDALNNKVEFLKQVPNHPHNRLKRKRKTIVMKNIIKQIEAANNNTNRFALGEFDFRPTSILNKTLISDTSIGDE